MLIATIILLIVLSGIFNAEMDTIKFRPNQVWFPNWKWYMGNPYNIKNKLLKTVLSMFLDGWHCLKFLHLISLFSAIGVTIVSLYNLSIWFIPVFAFAGYALEGFVFELTYGNERL